MFVSGAQLIFSIHCTADSSDMRGFLRDQGLERSRGVIVIP